MNIIYADWRQEFNNSIYSIHWQSFISLNKPLTFPIFKSTVNCRFCGIRFEQNISSILSYYFIWKVMINESIFVMNGFAEFQCLLAVKIFDRYYYCIFLYEKNWPQMLIFSIII